MQLRVKPRALITPSGLSPAWTLSTARIRISSNVLWSRARASRRFMPLTISYVYLLMNHLLVQRDLRGRNRPKLSALTHIRLGPTERASVDDKLLNAQN